MVRNTKNQNKSIKEACTEYRGTEAPPVFLSGLGVICRLGDWLGLSCRYQQQLSFGGGTAGIRSGTVGRFCDDGDCEQSL